MKKLLEANVAYGRRRTSQVFRDFCELSALSIRNSVDLNGRDEREARYLEIAGTYSPDELNRFAEALAHLTEQLSDGLTDALGQLYMSLDLGNERLGQFFTPYDVSLLTARLVADEMTEKLKTTDFVTVHEPASGSGGMIIALADVLQQAGVNYQQSMIVTAVDLDITAVHMSYIQLALLYIPAVIHHGNTLSLETRDAWHTPAYVLGGWSRRQPRSG